MKSKTKKIYFADLFAGIGGFHYAFDLIAKEMNFEIKCKYVSEIDKQAKENYCTNFKFPIEKIFDINDFEKFIDTSKLDIIFCGFPCQPFSNAGYKKGFNDNERGKLIFVVRNFVRSTKPKIVLLENVKYLANHNNQKTYQKIIKIFKDEGYIGTSINKPLIVSPHELNLKQRRERVFIPLVKKELFDKTISNNVYYWRLLRRKKFLIFKRLSRVVNKFGYCIYRFIIEIFKNCINWSWWSYINFHIIPFFHLLKYI